MRVSQPVDRERLEKAILSVEAGGPLSNQSTLFQTVATVYNKDLPEPFRSLEPGTVRNRVLDWNLTIQTKPGKRGRQGPMTDEHKAALLGGRGKREARAEKFAADPAITAAFVAQKKRTPVRLHTLIDRAEKGSMKAAVSLKCRECMGWDQETSGIRDCTSRACPLFAFRPFKPGQEEDAEIVEMGGVEEVETVTPGEAA
jgi:hypothetical protein